MGGRNPANPVDFGQFFCGDAHPWTLSGSAGFLRESKSICSPGQRPACSSLLAFSPGENRAKGRPRPVKVAEFRGRPGGCARQGGNWPFSGERQNRCINMQQDESHLPLTGKGNLSPAPMPPPMPSPAQISSCHLFCDFFLVCSRTAGTAESHLLAACPE